VAGALSRRDVEDVEGVAPDAAVHALSAPTFALINDIHTATVAAAEARQLL
jgi:hypothetical protein